jgi:hypothetical protein
MDGNPGPVYQIYHSVVAHRPNEGNLFPVPEHAVTNVIYRLVADAIEIIRLIAHGDYLFFVKTVFNILLMVCVRYCNKTGT